MAAQADKPAGAASRCYSDFTTYEARSIFLHQLRAPFAEADRRVLGHMASALRFLSGRYADLQEAVRISVILAAPVSASVSAPRLFAVQQSVLDQSYRNLELIVAGDAAGAHPETDDPRVRHLRLEGGGSQAAVRAAGLREARGEFLVWLDGSVTLRPDFIRILLGSLLTDPRAALAYCAQTVGGDDVASVRYASFSRALLENVPYIDLNCVLHARALLDAGLSFDAAGGDDQDWQLLLRLTARSGAHAVPCILADREEDRQDASHRKASRVVDEMLDGGRLADALGGAGVPGLERMFAQPLPARAAARRPVSIVIPSYECLDHLRLCIDAVRRFTAPPFELVVVDNASSPPVRQYLESIEDANTRVVYNARNLGFTRAANQGIQCSSQDCDLILLNNDAVVTPGWVEAMQNALDDVPEAGIVVPRQVLLPGTDTMTIHQPACNPCREVDVNLSIHHDNIVNPSLDPSGLVELSFAPFFCAYIPRAIVDALGLLDDEDAPHYRSDRLYCEAVRRLLQRKVVYTPHAKVYHFLQRATRALAVQSPAEYEALFVRNQRPESSQS